MTDAAKVQCSTGTRDDGGRVARVVVDNVRRLNALDLEQAERLRDAFAELAEDDGLRAVVLTGAGDKAFIGGADLNTMVGLDREAARRYITTLHEACAAIRGCPVPVVARVNGWCLGAGLEVAAACDMRVAVESARFGMPEVRVGLPSVIEAALLPGLIGWGRTRWLLLTGEDVSAAEALAMGLVEKTETVGGLDAAVERWLDAICAAGPQAIRAQKALIGEWERLGLEAAIEAGIAPLADAYLTDEPRRLMAPFFERKGR